MKISLFTSWDARCGIADYARCLKTSLEEAGATVAVVPVGKNKKIGDFITLGRLMNNADIAHIQHEYSFFGNKRWQVVLFSIFLRQIKVPVVITLHELLLPAAGRWYQARRYILFLLQKMLLSKVDLILVHTTVQYETVLKIGIKKEKVALLPHPIPEIQERYENARACKDVLGLGPKHVFTIFGFVSRRKGYDVAIAAVKDMEDAVLLIAGGKHEDDKSGYFQDLQAKIEDGTLRDRVFITGYISEKDIATVMGATDIVLAPYLDMYGSGSLSLAVAYHKPIIASDIKPMRDLKEQGMGLALFKSGDSSSLKDAMRAVLQDMDDRATLMHCTRQYAERFSYRRSAFILLDRYRRLIGRRADRTA